MTSAKRVPAFPAAPTLKEQGVDATFVNWRGFFAVPGLPKAKAMQYRKAIKAMYATPEWEAVRARNGWVNIHNSGEDFTAFLVKQEKVIGDLMKYVKLNQTIKVTFCEGTTVGIDLPKSVVLEVTHTEPGFRGDTSTNVQKPATVETGLEVKVPGYIEIGEQVRIDTESGKFLERIREK